MISMLLFLFFGKVSHDFNHLEGAIILTYLQSCLHNWTVLIMMYIIFVIAASSGLLRKGELMAQADIQDIPETIVKR